MPSDETLIQQAEEWKTKGNDAFQKGALQEAISAYSQGVVICDRITTTPLPAAAASVKATLLSNRAMCALKGMHFQPCIDDCTTAMALDINDAKLRSKILFRRSKARFLLSGLKSEKEEAELQQEAAKDLLQLLQQDPKNSDANQLLTTIRAQHSKTQKPATPVSKTITALKQATTLEDTLHQLRLLMGLLDDDLNNTSLEMARLGAIPLLFDTACNSADHKSGVFAMQCLSRAASYPLFVQRHFKEYQKDALRVILAALPVHATDLVVSGLAALTRIILHADRDDPNKDVQGTTFLEYNTILQACEEAIRGVEPDDKLILRAVLDVLSTWTCGVEREPMIRASVSSPDPTVPVPKTPADIRVMTPQELAAHRKREKATRTRDLAWSYERARLFCEGTGIRTLLQAACQCRDHVLRREITVVLGRIFAALDAEDEDGDRVKSVLQPLMASKATEDKGLTIEEVYNEDDEDEKQAAIEEEVVSLETKMERGIIAAALLLSKKEIGSWALGTGWRDSPRELPDLIHSQDPRAMCIASEVLSGASSVESARHIVTGLVSSGAMELLMKSDDRDIRSGAASAVAKLGLANKNVDEGERIGLLQAACDLLEEKGENELKKEESKKGDSKIKLPQFHSFAGSSVERAIEMLTYLVANTDVKEEIASGFQAAGATSTALERLVAVSDLPNAGESLSGFGLATIFQHLAVTNLDLKREAFEGKEVTMEQYDEMQKMGKTEEEKELMEAEKDTDTKELCNERIRKMASVNVPRALVALMEGASEHSLEQLVLAMSRMACEPTVRGIMIQQGVLSACIKIEKNEGPTETDIMKKVIRIARHCIGKLLITMNPALLTSAQRLGSIGPLIHLIRDIHANSLQHFEALLALTNIASSGEDAQNRIVSEKGIASLHYAMFSDHEMVRRAATEAMCNLVPHKAMMDYLSITENLKLWLAFASDYEDHYECARAATGCIAMATQEEPIALKFAELEKFREHTSSLLESGRLEIMYRAMVVVLNLVALGGKTKEKAISTGLVAFCKAYVESYHNNMHPEDVEFSKEERALLPVTVDIAKKIVTTAEE